MTTLLLFVEFSTSFWGKLMAGEETMFDVYYLCPEFEGCDRCQPKRTAMKKRTGGPEPTPIFITSRQMSLACASRAKVAIL
jgi:hypothetical protein